jgi:hypothetical protein
MDAIIRSSNDLALNEWTGVGLSDGYFASVTPAALEVDGRVDIAAEAVP